MNQKQASYPARQVYKHYLRLERIRVRREFYTPLETYYANLAELNAKHILNTKTIRVRRMRASFALHERKKSYAYLESRPSRDLRHVLRRARTLSPDYAKRGAAYKRLKEHFNDVMNHRMVVKAYLEGRAEHGRCKVCGGHTYQAYFEYQDGGSANFLIVSADDDPRLITYEDILFEVRCCVSCGKYESLPYEYSEDEN